MVPDIAALDSSLSCWEIGGYTATGIVVIGVVGESVVEFTEWIRSPRRRSNFGIASALILIFGLTVEILTQVKVNSLSGQIIAFLNNDTADAKLQLAKYRAWRQELLAEHRAEIGEKLETFKGTKFDTGLDLNSAEQTAFVQELDNVLVDSAKWVHVPWNGGFTIPLWIFNAGGGAPRPISAPVTARNVEIHIFAEYREQLEPAATALISVFKAAGIVATNTGPASAVSTNKDAIHIWVGEKQ
jgi:hypothetical protein